MSQNSSDSRVCKLKKTTLAHFRRGQLPKLKFENEIDRKTMETQLAHMDDILFVAKTYGHLRDTHSCEMAKLVE